MGLGFNSGNSIYGDAGKAQNPADPSYVGGQDYGGGDTGFPTDLEGLMALINEMNLGGSGSVSYPPRSVAEDIALLNAKYPIDIKLMEKEYMLAGLADKEIEGIKFKNAKELQEMDAASRMEYMKTQLKLTHQNELKLMAESHKNNKELQEDRHIFERLMQTDEQNFRAGESLLEREFTKEQKEEDRMLELTKSVNELRGRDPVRAALLAMGVGNPNDVLAGEFGTRQLEGADKLQAATEQALGGIEGLTKGGEVLSLGEQGVSGLANVEKAATSSVTGPTAAKTLIESAQGIGSAEQAGVIPEDVAARIAAVTPKGFDFQNAAEGAGLSDLEAVTSGPSDVARRRNQRRRGSLATIAGTDPVKENTVYQAGENGPEALVVGAGKKLEKIVPVGVEGEFDTVPNRDALVDMFNDPSVTIDRGSSGYDQETLRKLSIIRRKKAQGIDLSPQEQLWLNSIQASGSPSGQPPHPGGLNDMELKKQQILSSLSPAQRAALQQAAKKKQVDQQNSLVNSLNPHTIQKLMDLINNPGRSVNNNLQEVLPQLRDGAGNIAPQRRQLTAVA